MRNLIQKFKYNLHRFDWRQLRGWGNSKLIKSSYLWLLVVPIAAKMLMPIAGTRDFTAFGTQLEITIALPFQWWVFYFMAVFFAVGQAIYACACPTLIKSFGSFLDYRKAHSGITLLSQWIWIPVDDSLRLSDRKSCIYSIRHVFDSVAKSKDQEELVSVFQGFDGVEEDDVQWAQICGMFDDLLPKYATEPIVSDIFDTLSQTVAKLHRGWTYASTLCFVEGFTLFLVVMLQYLMFVFRAIGPA